jgi:hypothetical protein
MHPDRGGDRKSFLQLQKHFEQALRLVEGVPLSDPEFDTESDATVESRNVR